MRPGDGSRLSGQDRIRGRAAPSAEGTKPARPALVGARMEMSVALDSAEHVESVSDVMLGHRVMAGLERGLTAAARESEGLESVVGGVGGKTPCVLRVFRLGFFTTVQLVSSSTGLQMAFFTTVQLEPSCAGLSGRIFVSSESGVHTWPAPWALTPDSVDTPLGASPPPSDEGVIGRIATSAACSSSVGDAGGDSSDDFGKTAGCAFAFVAPPRSERLDRFCFDFLPGFGAGFASFSKLASKASCKA